ncbi:LacI family DNA-binding transcriptional regulator [Sphingobacterium corticibacterium]|uniref:LacI family transcriptional regulator n=1 Tax=Sphingobacterium corticibacterium TaxID=2484746 RepID=A0A4Q6XQJ3_9SPHI|nr:LacI family DNA-binding transcriptional regulator [Sphingobacterium corticibacterium]RZF59692.1 LacI family transcriptional regulator [Sphingobacterium corticibacterium]
MAAKKRISINDIAKAVGTSITTVSFILNGKAKERRISDAVNKRVLDYVKKVGYKPSQLVRKPAGRTKVIAFLVENIGDPPFTEIGRYIENIAAEHGYQILYCEIANDANKTRQHIQLCIEKEVDGVIVVPPEDFEEVIDKIKGRIPMVLFDRCLPAAEISYVVSDNRKGAYDATKYLLEQGNKRIGLVSLYSNQTHIRGRLDGYMDAMDEFRMQSFIRKLSAESPVGEREEQVREFIVDNKLDAVLFVNHHLTINGLNAMKGQAAVWPQMTAFDDHMLYSLHAPAVSAIVQDTERIAAELTQTLLMEIEGKLEEVRKIRVPCTLIVRESSIY